jgi:hypothetical protein
MRTARASNSLEKLWKMPTTRKSRVFIAPSAAFITRVTESPGLRPRECATPWPTSTPSVLVAELLAFDDLEQAAQPGLLVGLHALADDGKVAPAVVEQACEIHAPHHRIDLGWAAMLGDLLGLFDQEALGVAAALLEEVLLEKLQVAGLGVDDGFAELDEDVGDEAARQHQAHHPEHDRGEGHAGAKLLAQDVAHRELGVAAIHLCGVESGAIGCSGRFRRAWRSTGCVDGFAARAGAWLPGWAWPTRACGAG